MGIHPAFADRFYLLDGIPSIQAAMADPELDRRMREYMEPPLGPVPDVATRDLTVDGPHGPVPVRVYEPATGGADRPALLWLHGGAFMFGDLDMPEADLTAREICTRAGAVVVSVDYRLAVGGVHHPVPLDDCVAATRWLRDSAADLGVDPDRIHVGGASAGGNLATALTLRLRDEDDWQPASLVAIYPVLHAGAARAVGRGGRCPRPRYRPCCASPPRPPAASTPTTSAGRSRSPTATPSRPSPT